MKSVQQPIVFISKVILAHFVLEIFIVNSAIIDDPLQPVWHRIDHFSAEILGNFHVKLENALSDFALNMETKFTTYNSDIQRGSEEEGETAKNIEEIVGFLNNTFTVAYDAHLKDQAETDIKTSTNHIQTSLNEMQAKVIKHFDHTLGKGDIVFHLNETVESELSQLWEEAASASEHINDIEGTLKQITDYIPKTSDDTCAAEDDVLHRFIDDSIPSHLRMRNFEKEWQATYQAIVDDPQGKTSYRDCSDILWIHPQHVSGTYNIFPTRDTKREVSVWCDMTTSDNGGTVGGWTVVLRRLNTTSQQLNFNRTWAEYRDGFGVAGSYSEWWLGLTWLHTLTYHEPYEIMFLMHDIERGYFQAHYTIFRVEDESNQFRLIVDGFSGNVSDAFKDKHHGMPFTTYDRDNDFCVACNCAINNGGGWWYNVCHWTVLTSPYPTSNDREAKTIRWLSGTWLVLDDVTVMIRPRSFISRRKMNSNAT